MIPPSTPSSPSGQASHLGEYLAQARQAKALDRAVCAKRLALSVRQLQEIEEGGLSAFYNEQHKLLAMRKYAAFLSLEWPAPHRN